MKKLFLTLVTLISFTNVFAQESAFPIIVESDIASLNPCYEGPDGGLDFNALNEECGLTFTDDKGNTIDITNDVSLNTKVILSYGVFKERDYKILSIDLNDNKMPVKNSKGTFTVNGFVTIKVHLAKLLYDIKNNGTFVPQYSGTSDKELYTLDYIHGNGVYGTTTKKFDAGTPYIIKSGEYTMDFTPGNESFEYVSCNGLIPSKDNDTKVSGKECLIFYNGTLCFPNENGNKVPVGRAYINLKVAQDAYAKSATSNKSKAIMSFDDGTGIDNITLGDDSNNGPAYTISGQRVSNPTKGLYIINGKKVLMK